MPYIVFLTISLLWSSSFILMKKATLGYSPTEIAMWRCLWGAGLLGLLCWRNSELLFPDLKKWPAVLVVTVLGCAWPYAVQPLVIAHQGSAFMALAVSVVPLATIVASIGLLKVWPTRRQTVGVCGALICLGLLLYDGWDRQIELLDFLLALSVPLGYALANTILRGWLRELPASTVTFYLMVLTTIILLPATWNQPDVTASAETHQLAFWSLAFLGVFGTGLGTYWFNKLIREHGPLFAGMTTNVVPMGAVIWGWADNEYISVRQIVALAGIICMVLLVQFGAAKKGME